MICSGTMTHHGPPGKKKPKEASEKKRRVKIEGETTQGADDESASRETGSGDTTGWVCLHTDVVA